MGYSAKKAANAVLIIDGQVEAKYAAVTPPVFSRDSKRMGYAVDGRPLLEYEKIVGGLVCAPLTGEKI